MLSKNHFPHKKGGMNEAGAEVGQHGEGAGEGASDFSSLCDVNVADNYASICRSVEAGRERLKGMVAFWRT